MMPQLIAKTTPSVCGLSRDESGLVHGSAYDALLLHARVSAGEPSAIRVASRLGVLSDPGLSFGPWVEKFGIVIERPEVSHG